MSSGSLPTSQFFRSRIPSFTPTRAAVCFANPIDAGVGFDFHQVVGAASLKGHHLDVGDLYLPAPRRSQRMKSSEERPSQRRSQPNGAVFFA